MQEYIDALKLKEGADMKKVAIVYGIGAFLLSRLIK